MKEATSKAGVRLIGRPAELYLNDCPPERPCPPPDVIEHHQALYDDGFDPMNPPLLPLREGGSDAASTGGERERRMPSIRSLACVHLGRVLDRRDRACTRCWIHGCEVHGRCVKNDPASPLMNCVRCPDYEPDDAAG
jgi:hypothetical protein